MKIVEWPGGVMVAFGLSAVTAGALVSTGLATSGALIGSGIALLAFGLKELLEFYSSTAVLEGELRVEDLGNLRRASLFVYNRGSVFARGVRAVLSVDARPDQLRGMLAPCRVGKATINPINPILDGELLSWAEGYYEISISPRQYAELPLFELYEDGGKHTVEIFGAQGVLACLRLDKELTAKVYVSGENLREPLEVLLQIGRGIVHRLP